MHYLSTQDPYEAAKSEKIAKFKMLSFCQKLFSRIKYLHANVQCVYIVYAKYQMPTAKALVKVEFPMYALRTQILMKKSEKLLR